VAGASIAGLPCSPWRRGGRGGRHRQIAAQLSFAAVPAYLLMVLNCRNFGDPFVVIPALPATFRGIPVMVYLNLTGNERNLSPARRAGGSNPCATGEPVRTRRTRLLVPPVSKLPAP
jgi:hypothetical protein